ncbi:hypothetical protein CKO_03709 [Citrobacter koseri ATCC BAA-895]|uniref:Uncharacterized protein n=1 Tax=Citrobacter koseri (strain ATCC BAA-895 / CDC 4225-83 / SGSC4696) TaxID=290338 RepID=A8AMS1_CITK8|nr:hypothetical protein CKO_03709 [Citrobacter koseri ATCC BAA-895]
MPASASDGNRNISRPDFTPCIVITPVLLWITGHPGPECFPVRRLNYWYCTLKVASAFAVPAVAAPVA